MGFYQFRSLILSSSIFGESDKKVTFLTEEGALYVGIAKGALKSRRRFVGALEPLTEVSLSFFDKKGNAFVRLEGAQVLNSYRKIKEDLNRVGCGLYLCDLVRSAAPPRQKDLRIYSTVTDCLQELEIRDPQVIARVFEMQFLNLLGLSPVLSSCAMCQREVPTKVRDEIRFRIPQGIICSDCPRMLGDMFVPLPVVDQLWNGLSGKNLERTTFEPALKTLLKRLLEYHFESSSQARRVWEELVS